jgi:hypothetical protein
MQNNDAAFMEWLLKTGRIQFINIGKGKVSEKTKTPTTPQKRP